MRPSRLKIAVALLALIAVRAGAQIRVEPVRAPLGAAPAPIALSRTSALTPSLSAPSAPALTVPSLAPAPALMRAASPSDVSPPDGGPSAKLNSLWDGAAPARSVNSFWSGFRYAAEDAGVSALKADDSDTGSAAPYLALKDRAFAAALDRAVELARDTQAGRRALDAAERALAAENRILRVDVKDLGGNWGEYDYLDDRLRLHKRLFEKGREAELAGTLAHELLHVAQHAAGLPSNALELEIEAHLLDLELMAELGLETPPNTFSRQIFDALKKGSAPFIELIQRAVPGSPFLGESSLAEVADQLEEDLEAAQNRKGPHAEKLAAIIARDLARLRSKKGAAAYRAFSKRVLALLQTRAAEARH